MEGHRNRLTWEALAATTVDRVQAIPRLDLATVRVRQVDVWMEVVATVGPVVVVVEGLADAEGAEDVEGEGVAAAVRSGASAARSNVGDFFCFAILVRVFMEIP